MTHFAAERDPTEEGTAIRIGFLGDTSSPNSISWIAGLERQAGVRVIPGPRMDTFKRRMRPEKLLSDLCRLASWCRRSDLDVLIGYRTTSYGFLAALSGVHPLVLAAQGETDVWPTTGLGARVKERTARYAIARADLLHAWGSHMRSDLVRLGAGREKVLVMPRGIDTELFRPPDTVRDASRLVVASTRALYPEYHVDAVIRGVAEALRQGVPVQLRIAGDGEERAALKALAVEVGLAGCVSFLGRISREGVAALLREADVYASTPETEGISASLLEAMGSGCVPVVTDLPGNRDWVTNGANGFLVTLNEPDAVARALVEVWHEWPVWRARARQNVDLIREKASVDRNMARFVGEYRRLVAAQGRK